MALWWGIPAVCVELFWVPRDLWLYALILIVPATAVGVVTGAALLHLAAARRSKNGGEAHLRPK
jgi:membrane protein implicated in regulation of membrane protease activity